MPCFNTCPNRIYYPAKLLGFKSFFCHRNNILINFKEPEDTFMSIFLYSLAKIYRFWMRFFRYQIPEMKLLFILNKMLCLFTKIHILYLLRSVLTCLQFNEKKEIHPLYSCPTIGFTIPEMSNRERADLS